MSQTTKATQSPTRHSVRLIGITFFVTEIIVVSGAYSPFRLPKMALALSALAMVIGGSMAAGMWRGRLRLPAGPLVYALVALPALQTLSALWAQTPAIALRQALGTAIWVATAVWLSTFEAEDRRRILLWGVWGAMVSGCVLIAQLMDIGGVGVYGINPGDRLGLTGLAGNPSDLAMAGLLFLPLLLPGVIAKPRKWALWPAPVFLALTAILTQALTALVAAGLATLGCIVLLRSRKIWAGALIVSTVVLALLYAGPLRSRFQAEWEQMRQGNWYNLLSAREDGWTAAVTMIKTSPLLGVGAGQFSREFYPARMAWLDHNQELGHRGELATHFEWAHNDPLQLISELGLIGGLWLIVFVGALARSDPDAVIFLATLIWIPFLLLHYPTHLAIGLIPAVLVLAHSLHRLPRKTLKEFHPALKAGTVMVIGMIGITVVGIQLSELRLDRWRGHTEALMTVAEKSPSAKRRQILRKVESEAGTRIQHSATSAPWLWRIVGRARLLEGASSQAEAAFRRSLALEPHEEAEMGLGLALAGQGRTTEAVHFLTRACRVNPALVVFISDEDLKKSVQKKMRR